MTPMFHIKFKKGSKIAFGGFYIPNYDSFTSYFSRIVYRAGIRIEKTGLHIQNQSIDEYGINFGLGLILDKPWTWTIFGLWLDRESHCY